MVSTGYLKPSKTSKRNCLLVLDTSGVSQLLPGTCGGACVKSVRACKLHRALQLTGSQRSGLNAAACGHMAGSLCMTYVPTTTVLCGGSV